MIRLPENDPRRDAIPHPQPPRRGHELHAHHHPAEHPRVLARNWNYRNKDVKLYEFAKIYKKRDDGLADEPKVLTLGAYGGDMDFYSLKGTVEELCGRAAA